MLPPKLSRVIFKFRTRSIDCKSNRKSKFTCYLCRLCGTAVEDQVHVVNCPKVVKDGQTINVNDVIYNIDIEKDEGTLETICSRFELFKELVDEL